MGVVVVILVVIVITFFISDLNKDTKKLNRLPISEKFKPLINYLNEEAYNGRGTVTRLDKRQYNLYNEEGSNQIIQFFFTLNDLEITWRYKYLQEEAISKGVFKDAYETSDEDQINWAKSFIEKVHKEKAVHHEKMYGF